jgi:hypothetical protein
VMRASTDHAYMQLLRSDPVKYLVKEGLPYDVIEDFLRETMLQAEVSGYNVPDCANSCALTRSAAYPENFSL